MIRAGRFLIVAGTLTVIVVSVHLVPDALSQMDFFQVDRVEVEGLRFLEYDEAVEFSALTPHLSVWDDLDEVADRLARHPLVFEVRARRRLPSTLRLEVREREPVALYSTPTLAPVDRRGIRLPIDPARHRLDLPLLQAVQSEERGGLDSTDRRMLAEEVTRLAELEPRMAAALSEILVDPWGDVILRIGSPRVEVHYRPPLSATRLQEGIRILTDALERDPERTPQVVDLRFADQVVVRYPSRSQR